MLGCWVTPADVGDREGAKQLFRRVFLKYPDLHVWADGNYDGPLVEWAKNCYGYDLDIVVKPEGQKGFAVLPRRWVVERTLWWSAPSPGWGSGAACPKIMSSRRGRRWPSCRGRRWPSFRSQ